MDFINFENKYNKAVFIGASTGNPFNLLLNQRINASIWSLGSDWLRKHVDIKVKGIVQMDSNYLSSYLNDFGYKISDIQTKFMSKDEQLLNKFIISIDGNTYSWDRPIWVMRSNSLLMKWKGNSEGWYYPLLKENKHYISVDPNNFENQFNFYKNNLNISNQMINDANHFVCDYCNEKSWKYYFNVLFDEIINKI